MRIDTELRCLRPGDAASGVPAPRSQDHRRAGLASNSSRCRVASTLPLKLPPMEPHTPTALDNDANSVFEALWTPRSGKRQPATPTAPRRSAEPPLMKAIEACVPSDHKVNTIQAILVLDPEAAARPFEDFDFELPLCHAVQCGCNAQVIRLLLCHGADAFQRGAANLSAAEIVVARLVSALFQFDLGTAQTEVQMQDREVLKALLDTGADLSVSRLGSLGPCAPPDSQLMVEYWICFVCVWVQTAAHYFKQIQARGGQRIQG
mmetsp:Transcript_19650/g.45715  ORF Transcript_19650/g.45715 Transcript_19650/m.45715 type:complete len:263 (+) Transcript_19650:78-866(+)